MKMRKALSVCIPLMLCFAAPLAAQSGTALTLQAGTLGVKAGVVRTLSATFNARFGVAFMNYNYSGETTGEDPIAYDVGMNLLSAGLLADYHPFGNAFRLTGGLVLNNNIFDASAEAVNTYEYDGETYTPREIGTLTGEMKPGLPVSPYLGFGFGNPVGGLKRVGFYMDVGVLYTGSPDVTLEADEDAMIYPTADQDEQVEDDLSGIRIYPVVEIGMSYRL